MQLNPEEILKHWPTHGALWLMEDANLLQSQRETFKKALLSRMAPDELFCDTAKCFMAGPELHRAVADCCHNPEILRLLYNTCNGDYCKRWLVLNPPNGPYFLYPVQVGLAKNKNTPPDILAELSVHEAQSVRVTVASNTNTPPDILEELADDNQCTFKVAANPNTPPWVLADLSDMQNDFLREIVRTNPNTPPSIRTFLSTRKS